LVLKISNESAMNKIFDSSDKAVADVFDGATILCGGFGCVGGAPWSLFRALAKRPVKNLTIVGNAPILGIETQRAAARTMTVPDEYADAALLLKNGQVSKTIVSVPTMAIYKKKEPFPIVKAIQDGHHVEIELVAQGTLAERIRAAKAGVGGFYTRTGVGTYVAKGKEVREIDGEQYILERPIKADFAFIWAHKADPYGNLIYKGSSRTFNATMAGAAVVTIAEVGQIVNLGGLDPENIVTPAVYVNRIVTR
jgi:3-oxoadipate CoA-transferase alpha subunit